MKRIGTSRRTAIVVAVVLLVAAAPACSDPTTSSGGSDFADELDDICRQVRRDVRDIDSTEAIAYATELSDIVDQAIDDIAVLEPPKADEAAFADMTENLDDLSSAAKQLLTSLDAGDAESAAGALDQFNDVAADNDEVATDLGADRCTEVFSSVELPVDSAPTAATAPPETSAPTTTTADTTASTEPDPSITNPPETEPPATTSPATTAPPTSPPQTVPPVTDPMGVTETADLAEFYDSPILYDWDVDVTEILRKVFPPPTSVPELAPFLIGYGVGAVNSLDGGEPAICFVAELDSDFTPEQQEAYYQFEGLTGGTDISTEGEYLARYQSAADSGQTYDIIIAFFGSAAVTIRSGPQGEVAFVLDAFLAANTG